MTQKNNFRENCAFEWKEVTGRLITVKLLNEEWLFSILRALHSEINRTRDFISTVKVWKGDKKSLLQM